MRLLISVFSPPHPESGGLTRMTAIAEAAMSRGHQIAFCAYGYTGNILKNLGHKLYEMPGSTIFGLPNFFSRMISQRTQQISLPIKEGRSFGSAWLLYVISGMGSSRYLIRYIDEGIKAVRSFQPDLLITDYNPGAFLLAEVTGLPLVSTFSSIFTKGNGSFAWKMMNRATKVALRHYGKNHHTIDDVFYGPSIFKIIPTIPELDDVPSSRQDVLYVGNLLGKIRPTSPIDFNLNGNKKIVFVYVGTGSISVKLLRKILPKVFPDNGNYNCFVGAQSIKESYKIEAVQFSSYFPANEILPHCDWTICHGGQNTIIQSLLYGIPLILFPGGVFERRYNAEKVKEAGCGIMGEVKDFNVEWLISSLKRHSEFVNNAKRFSERICSYEGAVSAVRTFEQKYSSN